MLDVRFESNPAIDEDQLNALFATAWPSHEIGNFAAVLARSLAFVCAFQENRLVGFVNLAWDGGVHAFLMDPTVHPDFQSRGIGTRLVQTAISVARERGVEWLHVDYEERLARFYQRCGFQPTSAGVIRFGERPRGPTRARSGMT
jgi:GNAT superfamily N-acetyltransferase